MVQKNVPEGIPLLLVTIVEGFYNLEVNEVIRQAESIPEAVLIQSDDDDEPSFSGCSNNILSNGLSFLLKNMDLKMMCISYRILPLIEMWDPRELERTNWVTDGWVYMHKISFEPGFRFMFPKLMLKYLVHLQLASD